MNSITVVREVPHCLPHTCSPGEFVPKSWVLEHCHHVQEVPGVLGPHWFSKETCTSQEEGNVPFKSKGFAVCSYFAVQIIWGILQPVLQSSLWRSPFTDSSLSPTHCTPPPIWGEILSLFLLISNGLRATLAALPLQIPNSTSLLTWSLHQRQEVPLQALLSTLQNSQAERY